jgi:hypothetical protein
MGQRNHAPGRVTIGIPMKHCKSWDPSVRACSATLGRHLKDFLRRGLTIRTKNYQELQDDLPFVGRPPKRRQILNPSNMIYIYTHIYQTYSEHDPFCGSIWNKQMDLKFDLYPDSDLWLRCWFNAGDREHLKWWNMEVQNTDWPRFESKNQDWHMWPRTTNYVKWELVVVTRDKVGVGCQHRLNWLGLELKCIQLLVGPWQIEVGRFVSIETVLFSGSNC